MHKTSKSNKSIVKVLQALNISQGMVASGWGIALDRLYDLIGFAIEKTVVLMKSVAEENLSEQNND